MVFIDNIYYNIGIGFDANQVRKDIETAYRERERIRLIIDLANQKIELGEMKRFKKIFDELGVEKLEETCVICRDQFKRVIINNFLKIIPTKRPVKFI